MIVYIRSLHDGNDGGRNCVEVRAFFTYANVSKLSDNSLEIP